MQITIEFLCKACYNRPWQPLLSPAIFAKQKGEHIMTEATVEERISDYFEIEMGIPSSPENVTILTIGPSYTLYTIKGLDGWEVYVTNKTQQISVRKPIVDRITEYLLIERGIKRDPSEVQVLKNGRTSTIYTITGCDFVVSVTNKTQQISIILS